MKEDRNRKNVNIEYIGEGRHKGKFFCGCCGFSILYRAHAMILLNDNNDNNDKNELYCRNCVSMKENKVVECEDCGHLFLMNEKESINLMDSFGNELMYDYEKVLCEECREDYIACNFCKELISPDYPYMQITLNSSEECDNTVMFDVHYRCFEQNLPHIVNKFHPGTTVPLDESCEGKNEIPGK